MAHDFGSGAASTALTALQVSDPQSLADPLLATSRALDPPDPNAGRGDVPKQVGATRTTAELPQCASKGRSERELAAGKLAGDCSHE